MKESTNHRLVEAAELACNGHLAGAREIYQELLNTAGDDERIRICNDLAVIDALEERTESAKVCLKKVLEIDADCVVAKQNLALLETLPELSLSPVGSTSLRQRSFGNVEESVTQRTRTRVAILSILFNWPSTGGGTIHTAETGKFLLKAGYDVRHFYAVFPQWEIGRVEEATGVPSEPLHFEAETWYAQAIQGRFREAVDLFDPDYVIITDSWNFKPLLAEAMAGYRYFLRIAALECLCPLNNVRLLADSPTDIRSCPRHQLATPELCRSCVGQRERQTGALHRAERALSGYGSIDYDRKLRRAFGEAEGVLAVNPLIAEMVAPYAKAVHVVPSGFDESRFPWPYEENEPESDQGRVRKSIFFAGLTNEFMKGLQVLKAACQRLWETRQDFELVATGSPDGQQVEPFIRYVGWLSQEELPKHLRAADVLAFPTLAEEALGRSAVEAMGAGVPVVASRIGGLQFTVTDGATGLLFEPGNVGELAEKIERLFDDPELCERLGRNGRRRFEQEYTWDVIVERHYKRLFGEPTIVSNEEETVQQSGHSMN